MKTTHQIAAELLALPDVPLHVEGWCEMDGFERVAKMTGFGPEGTAILCQQKVVVAKEGVYELDTLSDPMVLRKTSTGPLNNLPKYLKLPDGVFQRQREIGSEIVKEFEP